MAGSSGRELLPPSCWPAARRSRPAAPADRRATPRPFCRTGGERDARPRDCRCARYREVLPLRFASELPQRAIAKSPGLSQGAARRLSQRARAARELAVGPDLDDVRLEAQLRFPRDHKQRHPVQCSGEGPHRPSGEVAGSHVRYGLQSQWHRTPIDPAKPSLRPVSRRDEPNAQRGHGEALTTRERMVNSRSKFVRLSSHPTSPNASRPSETSNATTSSAKFGHALKSS
jgi:hypothetical protein